jgi:hypothetical protein
MPENNFPPGGIADQILKNGGFPRLAQQDFNPSLPGNTNINPSDYTNNAIQQLNNFIGKGTSTDTIFPISPNQIDTSGRFPKQLIGADNEDLYAQGQSFWNKAGNATLKMLGTTATTFLQGTVGTLIGLGEMIGQGRGAAFYDNDFANALNDWTRGLENTLPNYYTARERDARWYESANIFTANFLFDGIIKNLGYAFGSVLSGGAWGATLKGIGLTGTLSRKGADLQRLAATMETELATIPAATRPAKALELLKSFAAETASLSGKALGKTDRFLTALAGTAGEATIESLNNLNEFRNGLIDEFVKENGYRPQGEDLEAINRMADNVGNSTFLLNTALLGISNYIQFPRILGMSTKGDKAIINGVETNALKNTEKGIVRAFDTKSTFDKLLYKNINRAGLFVNPAEGFEEIGQHAIAVGTRDYFSRKLRGENVSLLEGVSNALSLANSDEGWENFLIGALSGGIMTSGILPHQRLLGGKSQIAQRGFTGLGGERGDATQKAIELLNKSSFEKNFRDRLASNQRAVVAQDLRDKALRQGEILEAKDEEFNYTYEYLSSRIKYGKIDFVRQDIARAKEAAATQEDFDLLKVEKKVHPTETREAYLRRLENLAQHAEHMNSLYQNLNTRFGGVVNEKGEKLYTPEVLDKLVYAATKIRDYDSRIPQISETLLNNNISVQELINSVAEKGVPSQEILQETLAQIDKLVGINNDGQEIKEALKQNLFDILEITARRRKYLRDYNDITKHPEEYKEYTDEQGNVTTKSGLKKRTTLADEEQDTFRSKLPSDKRSLQDIIDQYGEGEQAEEDILKKIAASPYATKAEKELAKKLLEKAKGTINLNNVDLPLSGTNVNGKADINFEASAYDYEKGGIPVEASILRQIANRYSDLEEELSKSQSITKEELQKEQEEIDKAAAELAALTSKSKDQLNNTAGDPINTEEVEAPQDPAKIIERVFASTTANSEETNPEKRKLFERHQLLLSKLPFLKNSENYYELIVTANNEEALGLKGITTLFTKDSKYAGKETDPQEGPILKVVVYKDGKKKYHFVDEQGKKLKDPSIEDVVAAVAPKATLKWSNDFLSASGKKQNNFSHATEEEAKLWRKQWEEKRKEIFQWTGANYFPFNISRGTGAEREAENGISKRHAVVGSLIPKENENLLNTVQDLVQVTKGSTHNFNGEQINVTPGKAFFVYKNTFEYLNNRKLNQQEAETVFEVLKEITRDITDGKGLQAKWRNFLSGVVYFADPQDKDANKPLLQNNIFFRGSEWMFGKKSDTEPTLKIPFTLSSLEASKTQILQAIQEMFNNVNSHKLTNEKGQPFEEYYVENGELKSKTWPSYQHYLIQDTGNRDIPLTTNIRPLNGEQDRNYKYRYTWNPDLLQEPDMSTLQQKPVEKKENNVEKSQQPKQNNVEDIQQKKADIERRRQKSLSINVEKKRGKSSFPIGIGYNDLGNLIATIYYYNTGQEFGLNLTSKEDRRVITSDLSLYGRPENEIIEDLKNKVNQQYDAELAALEEKTTEQPKQTAYTSKNEPISYSIQEDDLIIDKDESYEKVVKRLTDAGMTEDAAAQAIQQTVINHIAAQQNNVKENLQPKQEDVKNSLQNTEPDDEVFSTIRDWEYIKGNMQREKMWIEKKLGIPVAIAENIIKKTDGGYAFGKLKDKAITLWEGAQQGTGYHEAFEAVWNIFTTRGERVVLLGEFRRRKGTFIDDNGNTIEYKNATDFQAKEQMAEEFRHYVLNREPKRPGRIAEFIKKLWNWIKDLFVDRTNLIKELYQKIDSGKYKSTSPLYAIRGGQYSTVPGLDATSTYNIVEGLTTKVFQQFFKAVKEGKRSLLDFDFSYKPMDEFFDEAFNSYFKDLDSTKGKYEGLKQIVQASRKELERLVRQKLRTLNIQAPDVGEDNESEEASFSRDEAYLKDAFKWTGKRNAPASIRLLISTLIEQEWSDEKPGFIPKRDDQGTYAVRMASTQAIWNRLLSELTPLNTPLEKEEKLRELAAKDLEDKNPLLSTLAARLGIDKTSPTDDDMALRAKFFSTFSKQRPVALVQVVEDGAVFLRALNQSDAIRRLTQDWVDRNKWQENDLVYYNEDDKLYYLNQDSVNKLLPADIRSFTNQLKVLQVVGIPTDKDVWEGLNQNDKKKFGNRVARIYDVLKSKDKKKASSPSDLKLETPFKDLAELWIKNSGEYPESTFVGLTGERRAEFVEGNTVSRWVNDINAVSSIEELHALLPHLKNTWAQNSQYLTGDKLESTANSNEPIFEFEYVQGTNNRDEDDRRETQALTEPQRLLQEINLNLGGHFYVVLPADAKTEYTLKVNPVVPLSTVQGDKFIDTVRDILNQYYQVERQLYKDDKKERLLQPVVQNYSAKTISKEKIENWLNDLVGQQKQFLQEHNILKENEDGTFSFKGLNTDFTAGKFNAEKLTKEELNHILQYRTINYAIHNIEMMKLFFGDPAAYGSTESILKRIKSFLSPREQSIHDWEEFNSYANRKYNKAGDTELQPGDFGFYLHKDHVNTITLSTVNTYTESIADDKNLPEELSEKYGINEKKKIAGSDSTDGQAFATLPGYREMRIKRGHTWSNADEELMQYWMAEDRQAMLEDGLLDDNTYRKELQQADKALLEKGTNTEGEIYILKPVGSGYTAEGDPFLDKMSIQAIRYKYLRNSALGMHYVEAVKRGIGYLAFDTARKVGANTHPFYNSDNKADTNYSADKITAIPYRYIGIQTETAGSHEEGKIGSQMSKYITTNIYDGGKPSDYSGTLEEWIKLSAEEKKKASPRHALAEHNREVREKMTEEGYQRLLRKLGIDQEGNTFEVDRQVVLELLQDELFRRELPSNIADALSLDSNGNWTVPLEALNNYREIKSVIYSFVQKYISKPSVNGGGKVMASGVGLEVNGMKVKKGKVNGKDVYVSSSLDFYGAEYNKEGKIVKVKKMQVFISPPKNIIRMFPGKSSDEMFNILKSSSEGEKILSAIGFRIPTQEMNSIESFEIAGFLPIGYVDTVVVPEALTTKAGSDFDVDKLNTYLKNIYKDPSDNVHLIKYFASREESDTYYREVFKEKLQAAYDKAVKSKEKTAKMQNFFGEIAGGTASQKAMEKWTPIFHEMFPDMDAVDVEDAFMKRMEHLGKSIDRLTDNDFQQVLLWEFLDKMYWKGLENEYFQSMEDLILHPDNYERLIRPNNADKSKDIAGKLQELAPKEFGSSVSSILNPAEMSRMRHLFLLAKQWVGMVAVHATGHTLTQKYPIILDERKLSKLSKDEKEWIKNVNIALPHTTIEWNGKQYATLSNAKNPTGEYISDVISRRLDGTVDAVKSPWLSVIIQNTNMVGVYLLLDRLSVPEQVSAFFLNQPIIRMYNKLMDTREEDEHESDVIKKLQKKLFPKAENEFVTKFPTQDVSKLSKHLQDNIELYYKGGKVDNAEQQFIFNEFMKYKMIAKHLQKFNQATSYDTASFNDINIAEYKEMQTGDVQENNLFSSVENVLGNTYLGTMRNFILKANYAISSTLFVFDTPAVRKYLYPMFRRMKDYLYGTDSYLSSARKLEQGFIQYLIQTTGLNTRLKELLVNEDTNIAKQLMDTVARVEGTELANNKVLEKLIVAKGPTLESTKNIQLLSKAFDVFTSNIYTAALQELKSHYLTKDFYHSLVDAAFLQAGISQQNNSFSDIIPNEDFRNKLQDAISKLTDTDLLENFEKSGAFFRNRWWDTDVVPRARFKAGNKKTNQVWKPANVPFLYAVNGKARASQAQYITIRTNRPEFEDVRDDSNRVVQSKKSLRKQMAKRGDFSFQEITLLRRVEDGGIPVSTKDQYGNDVYYYQPIKAWGDAQRAQEYYSDYSKKSVLKNNTYDPGAEPESQVIANAFIEWDIKQNSGKNSRNLPNFNNDNTKQNEVNSLTLNMPTNHSMSYKMPSEENLTGKNTSTLELAEQGLRTATTRSYPLGKVGSIITFEGRPQQYRITDVEQLTADKVKDPIWIKQWSQKEQWTEAHFKKVLGGKTVHVGSWQTSFVKVTPLTKQENSQQQKLDFKQGPCK